MAAPKAKAPTITLRTAVSLRRAMAKAPIRDPTLTVDSSNVKVASVPSKVRFTNSGSTTWKLNANVPTMVIMTSGIQRSGVRRA